MNVELFIVSFRRDLDFLRYALRSINKFTTGFSGVTVVVPNSDFALFDWVEGFGAKLKGFDEAPGRGMLHHEYQIICADVWCPEADVIVLMDSDCLFWEDATPADYVIDGRPVLYRELYDGIKNRLRLYWRTAVKAATGIDCPYECMVRHPSVHLPETFAKTREVIATHTGRSVENYILSCRNEFPQSFAEFPTLGAVALKYFPDRYHWVDHRTDTPDGGYQYVAGVDRMAAMWTHGGVARYKDACEAIIAGWQAKTFSAAEVK